MRNWLEQYWIVAILYVAGMNLLGLAVMWSDKRRAQHGKWRIPEKILFLVSLLGGSIGIWAGMYLFRHKTRHWYFVVGMPLILVLQVILLTRALIL